MTTTIPGEVVKLNGRHDLWLPSHRVEQWRKWEGGWERERLDSMCGRIEPGMVVYECGAEEGDFSALCATWVQGACRHCRQPFHSQNGPAASLPCRGSYEPGGVVLFEPSAAYWPNIRATFEGNDLVPLACFAGFAGDVDRGAALYVDEGWPGYADGPIAIDPGFSHLSEHHLLPCARIDTVAQMVRPPDAIAIDTEGSELRVLLGAQRTLREHRPLVWVSVHPQFMREMYDDEPEDLHALMDDLGYRGTHLATDHEVHFLYEPR